MGSVFVRTRSRLTVQRAAARSVRDGRTRLARPGTIIPPPCRRFGTPLPPSMSLAVSHAGVAAAARPRLPWLRVVYLCLVIGAADAQGLSFAEFPPRAWAFDIPDVLLAFTVANLVRAAARFMWRALIPFNSMGWIRAARGCCGACVLTARCGARGPRRALGSVCRHLRRERVAGVLPAGEERDDRLQAPRAERERAGGPV